MLNNYFTQQLSLSSFSLLSGKLYLLALEKKCSAELICTLALAQDLDYQYCQQPKIFFIHLKEIMRFYLS